MCLSWVRMKSRNSLWKHSPKQTAPQPVRHASVAKSSGLETMTSEGITETPLYCERKYCHQFMSARRSSEIGWIVGRQGRTKSCLTCSSKCPDKAFREMVENLSQGRPSIPILQTKSSSTEKRDQTNQWIQRRKSRRCKRWRKCLQCSKCKQRSMWYADRS